MITTVLRAPSGSELLNPAWLTAALQPGFPGAEIARARLIGGTSGTTDRVRIELEYSHGSGPVSVFVKKQGSLTHRIVVAATGMLCNEARFYAEVDEGPFDRPVAYATATDRRRLNSVLLLEDLEASGARANISTRPITVQECASGLRTLAGLHAHYWPGNGHDEELPWLPRSMGGLAWYLTVRAGAQRGVPKARAAGLALPGTTGHADRVTALWRAHCRRASTATVRTVVHGDAHVGNTYLRPGGVVGLLDWQIVARGAWFFDTPYFLVGALEIADRRSAERDLLRHYLETLAGHGAAAPTFERAWAEHRRSSMYGLAMWLCTLGFGNYQPADVCLAYIERYSAAHQDHHPSR